jgi:hypothetical protein
MINSLDIDVKDIFIIEDIIRENEIAKLIDNIIGICSIINFYKTNDFKFQLIDHENVGICIRLPINRDRSQDKEKYAQLRQIGEKIVNLLNES